MPVTSFFQHELTFFSAHEAADVASVRPDDHYGKYRTQGQELPVAEQRIENDQSHSHGHGAQGYVTGDENHHEEAGHSAEQGQEGQRDESTDGGSHALAPLEAKEGGFDVTEYSA